MLRVHGKTIRDGMKTVQLKGFNLRSRDVFETWGGARLELEDFQQIKAWGFNTVRIGTIRWASHIEPDESQIGVYNEENLKKLERIIELCAEAGLYFIFSMRVTNSDRDKPAWQGWALFEHLMTDEGLNRYVDMWKMLLQRFDHYPNVIGYCTIMYPFHSSDVTGEHRARYNNVVFPRLLQTVRAYSEKIYFHAPIHCGGDYVQGQGYESLEYERADTLPLPDKNTVYMHSGYQPIGDAWDGNINFMREQLEPARAFSNTYDVPLIIAEMGITIPVTDPSNRAKLKAKLTLVEESHVGWLAWSYGLTWTGSSYHILNEDGTPTESVAIYRQFPVSETVLMGGFDFLLPISVILLLLLLAFAMIGRKQ